MNWIAVSDRKPEWGKAILVYRGKLCNSYEIYDPSKLPPLIELSRQYDGYITHWLELPELPEDL